MNSAERIRSILQTATLDETITGFPSFQLSALQAIQTTDIKIPTNLRLGQLVEKVVAQLIQSSENYSILHESVQIIEEKQTIGELDFMLQEESTKQILHVELAYKFYVFDPKISANPLLNWIGPNRKDALHEKLIKLRQKQFPLLYHEKTAEVLTDISMEAVSQRLCLLASLFLPYQYADTIDPQYEKAVKGYYVNFETFKKLDTSNKYYHFPSKKSWGMEPAKNDSWVTFQQIRSHVEASLQEQRSLLCWQKQNDAFSQFFIVWW